MAPGGAVPGPLVVIDPPAAPRSMASDAAPVAPAASAPDTPEPLLICTWVNAKNRIIAGIATLASTRTTSPVKIVLRSWPVPISANPMV